MSQTLPRLAVIGAGPKAIAVAAKAAVLKALGKGEVDVVVFDEADVAAHWDGAHGFTDGHHRLGTPP
jgi:mycobactin lysine-N-oxygenase